ncbi:hypothetical protein GYM62_11865 [Algoriphagus sp. NBT04N3]|jgi:putative component of toxin-antitoxin plasmid stabilization module|uniref:hypothetical protein n=1 Tax=Algoriphagus sp. NBT04N3 TaxID=2705473 RepID=UPI001C637A5E|nr:hypothetical protein [Algoriphagus sp. NBT04N3]QYH39444.1 hypothetical protein GYM62_11865 [Algoriphagus sp. NBT04N3]
MQFELVKIEELSGKKASIYSILLDGEDESLFERFLSENSNTFKNEIFDILSRLRTIANKTGAREGFFKLNEGKPGDGICALYDQPGSNLRLYCIRFGHELIILGGGGPKSKSIRAFQEDEKLEDENYRLRGIAQQIMKALREKDIRFSRDFLDFEGDLIFEE